MTVETRLFGNITIDDDKIINFPGGIVGFPDLKDFALMHDSENSDGNGLSFLVSIQEPAFSMPVMNPLLVRADYNPVVEDDYLIPLGELSEEEMLVLVTVTVPHEIEHMSVNLMAPIIINAATRKAAQVILNDDEAFPVKYPIYDILAKAKAEAEKGGKADK
ncbi:MAG: flagellar assembly protein FliW [Lachnospiraceae bacterium]|nr:flagellar assembly protein FliW [Lachnospiraceae bacterium]